MRCGYECLEDVVRGTDNQPGTGELCSNKTLPKAEEIVDSYRVSHMYVIRHDKKTFYFIISVSS